MIRQLSTRDVGPSRALDFEFAPRLNILTGDNGLGKTFVLDVIWWLLTGSWARGKAYPWRPGSMDKDAHNTIHPAIHALLTASPEKPGAPQVVTGGLWNWPRQEWLSPAEAREVPDDSWLRMPTQVKLLGTEPSRNLAMMHFHHASLVVYARLDGTYATWDPNLTTRLGTDLSEGATVLTSAELWNGREVEDERRPGASRTEIRGLISDWATWQQRPDSREMALLSTLLKVLSPPDEPLLPGKLTRVDLRDRRDIPTLETRFSEIPVTLASAGMARVLSLAYLLTWAWTEHTRTAELTHRPTARHMVVLLDEPELHLHPSWQRGILPSILKTAELIDSNIEVQLITTTHSPLVMASVESFYDEEVDNLFILERGGKAIRVEPHRFGKEGDVSSWLSSEVFGAVGGRSREAQLALEAAGHFMADRHEEAEAALEGLHGLLQALPAARWSEAAVSSNLPEILSESGTPPAPLLERIHRALTFVLPGHDEFWAHWSLVYRPSDKAPQEKTR